MISLSKPNLQHRYPQQTLSHSPPLRSISTMNCISSSTKSCLLRSNFRQSQRNPPSQSPNLRIFPQIYTISPQRHRLASPKANAIPLSCLVLANSTIPPSQSGDMTVILKTGSVLLIAYLIANFIVPEFLMRSARSDDENDGKAAVEEEEETGKKQGFGGKKR